MDEDEAFEPVECVCADLVPKGQYYHCPECDTEWFPEDTDDEPTLDAAPPTAAPSPPTDEPTTT